MTGSAVTPPPVATAPATPAGAVAYAGAMRLARLALRWPGALACLALAALTLLVPSAPTYDPWAWIVWGREILHLDLSTVDGPSWKPLPVAFTTLFAPFGGAAPGLWMLVARAGAFAGVLAAFRLARRLADRPRLAGGPAIGIAAGAAAAIGLAVAPWYVRNAALGNSEGMQVAFALAAAERLLAGRRGVGFALALGLGLLRPEAWPFVGLLGLWLLRSEPALRRPVVGGLVLTGLCWVVPEWIGSGDPLRAAHRAQQPVGNSPAFSDNPVVEVLREGAAMLTTPVWVGLALAVAVALWRRERHVAVLGVVVAAWTVLVAAMTAHGYSGNQRYLIVPAAAMVALAAVGLAWGVAAVVGLVRALAGSRPPALAPAWARALGAAGLAAALGAALLAPWADRLPRLLESTSYQARLVDRLGGVVRRAGGRDRLLACGRPWTGQYLVPALAWQMRVHTSAVGYGRVVAPAIVFRVRTYRGSRLTPALGRSAHAPLLVDAGDWHVVAACR
jgi:hypothetical protein